MIGLVATAEMRRGGGVRAVVLGRRKRSHPATAIPADERPNDVRKRRRLFSTEGRKSVDTRHLWQREQPSCKPKSDNRVATSFAGMAPLGYRTGFAMTPLKLLVTGCRGRMGQAVSECANADAEVLVAAQIDAGDDLDHALAQSEAVIDFSHHSVTAGLAEKCAATGRLLVIGTTGHDAAELAAIRSAAERLPIVFAPNFSIGVNTLFWLTRRTTEILGPDFDLEVVEMHHNQKIDSPSGTAKRLGEILAEAAGLHYEADTRHGRVGNVGARTKREIGMHAIRGGDVVGDHTVIYASTGERVELTHKASSRHTFAKGAIRAAKWLRGQRPGLYDMQDVLGLK